MKKILIQYRKIAFLVALCLSIIYYFALPKKLFKDPYSTVLESSNGMLLSASIASDGQWRFPRGDEALPSKYVDALIIYEDKRFYNHFGVDVLSLMRALHQNIKSGRVVSGGSTISMQVIRLSRKGKSRTFLEKMLEMILATRLEFRYSKDEILGLYASHAPFGGNVVGLDAACWRYFGRYVNELSWSEAALLAALPNAPSLIHPGKNRDRLKRKRNAILDKLHAAGKLDELTCTLAKEEDVPDQVQQLPRYARHLLARMNKEGYAQKKVQSTIDYSLQIRIEQILSDHHQRLIANQVYNACAIVANVNTGEVLAYAGNVVNQHHPLAPAFHGDDVDIITSPRSTGSILKPFLFAAMLDEGKILPKTLLPDVPTFINGFSPKNFSKQYDGAVAADVSLIRSLNIPAVHMLRDYRYEKFYTLLKNMGMTTLNQAPDHYGLSLILGGAEGTLWDVTGMYASMARTLNNWFLTPGKDRYQRTDFHSLTYHPVASQTNQTKRTATSWLSASAIYQTFDALKELYRPGEESGWRQFFSAKKIAWKTGTSYGFRDAWAVGVTPEYAVGIWIGNADGEGRPGLTGTDAAAPVMFEIFSQLDGDNWFLPPKPEMEKITACSKSGLRTSALCEQADTVWVTKTGLQAEACAYHKKVFLSADKTYRVHGSCESLTELKEAAWFVLPPVQEFYFRSKNISYRPLPPFRKDCQPSSSIASMDMIYPKPNARIFIPRDIDGKPGSTLFHIAHANPSAIVYWHLNGSFIGSTVKSHILPLHPAEGKHILTVIDESGESIEQSFEVLSSK